MVGGKSDVVVRQYPPIAVGSTTPMTHYKEAHKEGKSYNRSMVPHSNTCTKEDTRRSKADGRVPFYTGRHKPYTRGMGYLNTGRVEPPRIPHMGDIRNL